MARAVIFESKRCLQYEPFYDIDPRTGASIEVFYADRVLAKSFGTHCVGWFWWSCQHGDLPGAPTGPSNSSYIRSAGSRASLLGQPIGQKATAV